MRVLVFAALLSAAPAIAFAGGGRGAPAPSHLDLALGACQRDVFEHGPDVVGDFDVYRRELARGGVTGAEVRRPAAWTGPAAAP